MEWLKNPVVLGVLAFCLVYLYYWHDKKKMIEDMRSKLTYAVSQGAITNEQANQKMMELESEWVPLYKPLLAGLIVWLAAVCLFGEGKSLIKSMNDSSDLIDDISEEVSVRVIPCSSIIRNDKINMNMWK